MPTEQHRADWFKKQKLKEAKELKDSEDKIKVIELFKKGGDNSVITIAKKLDLKHGIIGKFIDEYLKTLIPK